jgi:hypothetical protein
MAVAAGVAPQITTATPAPMYARRVFAVVIAETSGGRAAGQDDDYPFSISVSLRLK